MELDTQIYRLKLSARTKNCLINNDIFTLRDLIALSDEELRSLKGYGSKAHLEICELIKKLSKIDPHSPSFYHNLIDIETSDVPFIMEAHPDLAIYDIEDVYFLTSEGLDDDIDIKKIHFSPRTENGLLRKGHTGLKSFALTPIHEAREYRGVGEKFYTETTSFLKSSAIPIIKSPAISAAYESYVKRYSSDYPGFMSKKSSRLFLRLLTQKLYERYRYLPDDITVDCLQDIQLHDICEVLIKQHIISLAKNADDKYSAPKEIVYDEIRSSLPKPFLDAFPIEAIVHELVKNGLLMKWGKGYTIYRPTLDDWVKTLPERQQEIINLRLSGLTRRQCSERINLSAARIQQIESKLLIKRPSLIEDMYKKWYTYYDINQETFCSLFNINKRVYNFLKISSSRGCMPFEDIANDDSCPSELKSQALKIISETKVLIDGEYVELSKQEVLKNFITEFEPTLEHNATTLFEEYEKYIDKKTEIKKEKYTYGSYDSFLRSLINSYFTLSGRSYNFRLYDISELDSKLLVSKLHLENYTNVKISAKKIFDEHPEVMQDYDIRNEYELHNLLRKTYSEWNRTHTYNLELTRTPHIIFGEADELSQAIEILTEISPATPEEFTSAYSKRYGVLQQTVTATIKPLIEEYYFDGLYKIDLPEPSEEEFESLRNYTTEDFYFTADIIEKFKSLHANSDITKLNIRTYKKLGYNVYDGYIIKNTYASVDEFFTHYFTSMCPLDLTNCYIQRIISSILIARNVLNKLKYNLDILEIENQKFVSYKRFTEVNQFFNKDDLYAYIERVKKAFSKTSVYSIKTIMKRLPDDPIYEVSTGPYFIIGVLKNTKQIRFTHFGNGYIFTNNTTRNPSAVDLAKVILGRKKWINLDTLIGQIEEQYGIIVSKDRLKVNLAQSEELYFDKTMDKIYINKDEYYNDLRRIK